jgi:TupA-like ATPgrasp
MPARHVLRFRRAHGRMPPLRPVTFNEKIHWRLRYDRREILAGTCDKLAMKEHARRLAPGLVHIPETLWSGTDVAELATVDLPERWVLKPNAASGLVLFGHGAACPEELRLRTRGWLDRKNWRQQEEWAYGQARSLLLVEEFVGSSDQVPADLKVLVFDGVPRVVAVHTGRMPQHRNRLYTPDWEPLPWSGGWPAGPDLPRPQRLEDMLKAASALGAGFDMLRVDFYEHDGVLWFGELTPYPGAGTQRIEPELDALQGHWWTLPARPLRFFLPVRRTTRVAAPDGAGPVPQGV